MKAIIALLVATVAHGFLAPPTRLHAAGARHGTTLFGVADQRAAAAQARVQESVTDEERAQKEEAERVALEEAAAAELAVADEAAAAEQTQAQALKAEEDAKKSAARAAEREAAAAQRKKDAEARREARKWAAEQRREAMGPAKSDAELESEAKDFAGRLWGALTPGASDLSRDQGGDATDAEYSDYSEDAAATAIGAATGRVVTWDFNSKMDDGGAAVPEESELEENQAERLADEAFFALSTSAESMDPIITDDSDDDELSTLSSATATSVVNQVKRGRGKRNKKPKKARGFGRSPQEPRGTDKASGSRPGPTANVWKRQGFDASIQKESWHRAYDENSKAGFPDSRLG